jgi:chromate transporter
MPSLRLPAAFTNPFVSIENICLGVDNPSMTPETTHLQQPSSKIELFIGFTLLALQGVGGVLTVAQRELVERRKWMTNEQFVEEWSVAQVMPGPNVVNLGLMLGGKYFGLAGAAAAVSGLLVAPLILVLGLAILFGGVSDNPIAQGALKGMGAVSAGLIIATGIKLSSSLRQNPMGLGPAWLLAVAAFVMVGILRVPLAWALLGLGLLGCGLAFRALSQTKSKDNNS